MKTRVAFLATLILLVALVLLPVYNSLSIAKDRNTNTLSEIKTIAQLVGSATETDAANRMDSIDSFRIGNEFTVEVTDADRLSELGINTSVKSGTVHKTIYAIYQYEDGAFLLISAKKADTGSVLSEKNGLLLIGIMLIAGIAGISVMWITIDKRAKMIDRVMKSLDEFSDGNFDVQIVPLSGDDTRIAEYNAIIDRIQKRVFKQRSHNLALSLVMSQMQNGIIAVDEKLNVLLVTSVAKHLLGINGIPDGHPLDEVSSSVRLSELFTEAMQQKGVYTSEVAARTAAGRGHRPLRLYVSPMRDDNGKLVGALAMVEDITEIRRLEQVRTDFAANVSHELKTPLTSIRGFVETLEAGAIDNPEMAHKFLKIIISETERLTRLINDILSISKLESGKDEVTTERLRLDKAAFDVCEMLSIHANEKQITINAHVNDEPVYIMANKDQLKQLLINLVENAIKYNRPGGSVTVQVFADETNASLLVSDTGIGIAEEHLPRLFERFYRVDKGRSRQMGGTGLGLAIVKHIVQGLNGNIEVHSKLGEGTEFLITIPLTLKDNPEKDTIFNDEA